ncbi:hypothetical protein MOQ72_13315 [Saccharopolyspora sp. K220]|uniref:hypothetical protein n=1 Tax=Saccharopolyspora soli TaxID=2926618 RepID=UPI001F58B241|nr:hypothetical protein [Saccharopolyspora soli]MCI2418411.1 hypothetical protein [Saccharopolyspora soli]
MVGELIRLRFAVQRHTLPWKRRLGGALGVLAAAATWAAVAISSAGARSDVITFVLLIWLVGWLVGPILTSGASVLRPEYFSLLPLPPRRLGLGLLASVFVGVGGVVTALALTAIIGHALLAAALLAVVVAVVVTALYLVLVISLSRIAYALLGAAMRTRLGVEIAAIQYGLLLSSLFAGWLIIWPVLSSMPGFLRDGFGSAPAGAVLGWTPAGWPIRAVDAAANGDFGASAAWLALLACAALLSVLVATALLRPFVGNRTIARRRRPIGSRVFERRGLLPESAFGAVVGKELRTWLRDPWRSLELRASLWFGIFLAVYSTIGGLPQLSWLGGVAVALISAISAANLYGQDGTALWQLVVTDGQDVIRADVRGRQVGVVVAYGLPAVVLAAALMAISGSFEFAVPVATLIIVLLGVGSGLSALLSVIAVTPGVDPHRRVNPSDAGENQLVGQLGLYAAAVLSAPAATVAIILMVAPNILPPWAPLAAPVLALVNAAVVAFALGDVAARRLRVRLPETFARLRYPGVPFVGEEGGGLLGSLERAAEKEAIAATRTRETKN